MPLKTSQIFKIILGLLFWFIGTNTPAAVDRNLILPPKDTHLNANEIARQVYFTNHFYAFDNFSVSRRGKTSTVLINRLHNGKESSIGLERHINNDYDQDDEQMVRSKDLAIFHSGSMRGTRMLITEYTDTSKGKDYTVWLPELGQMRRLSQPQQDVAWGASTFTFGDIALRKLEDETHELIGKKRMHTCLGAIENLEGKHYRFVGKLPQRSCRHANKEVYGLKSTTRFNNWWYDYRISYVDTQTFADYRTLYYKRDKLIKIIDRDWGRAVSKDIDDPRALFWKYWYGIDLRTGQESWAIVPQKVVDYNTQRKHTFWTEKALRRIER
jgi:hypothetical protein